MFNIKIFLRGPTQKKKLAL